MKNVKNNLEEFERLLRGNGKIIVQKFFYNNVGNKSAITDIPVGDKILQMYEIIGDFTCKWVSADNTPDVLGSARILPFEQCTASWKEDFFANDEDHGERIQFFHPIDFLNDQACVGFFAEKGRSESLYFYDLAHPPDYLQVDINAYIEMMVYAKAYRYWPLLILEIISGEKSRTGEEIRKNLPILFPEFIYEEFTNMFNRLKI